MAVQNSSPRCEHFTGPKTWVRDGWAHVAFDAATMRAAAFIFPSLTDLLTFYLEAKRVLKPATQLQGHA
jgi:hypothetical protein